MGRSSNWSSNWPSATARRIRTASRVTSGPIPSPGRTATLYDFIVFASRTSSRGTWIGACADHYFEIVELNLGVRNRGHLSPALLLGAELPPELHIIQHAHGSIHGRHQLVRGHGPRGEQRLVAPPGDRCLGERAAGAL